MNQINSLIIEGNLVREPVIKDTVNKSKVATFSMAVNRYYKKADGSYEQEVSYFDVEAWGNFVDVVEKNGKKGCGCRVVGRLKQSRWKDGEGRACSKVSIVAEHIDFMQSSENAPGKFDRANVFGNQEADSEEEMPAAANGFDIF